MIADIRAQAPVEIVVIDDGSGDGTAAEAVHAGARVITLPFNLGIGSAVQTGYMAAQEGDFDVAIQVDGDGQHPAAEITPARRRARRERRRPRDRLALPRRAASTARRSAGASASRSSRASSRLICGIKVTDTTSGFRAGNRRAIALFAAAYPHDYPEVEAVIIAHRAGLRIVEVPVRDARAPGRPLVDHAAALGVLHGQGAHGRRHADAAAPRQAPGRAMTRVTLVSLIAAIALLLFVLELVRRRRLQERYSVLWLAHRAPAASATGSAARARSPSAS